MPVHATHVPLVPILMALPASKPTTLVAEQHVALEPHTASIVLVPSLEKYSTVVSQVFQSLQQLASSVPEGLKLPEVHAAHVPARPVAVMEPAV